MFSFKHEGERFLLYVCSSCPWLLRICLYSDCISKALFCRQIVLDGLVNVDADLLLRVVARLDALNELELSPADLLASPFPPCLRPR